MTDKSDDKVGHLNTILAIGGGNLNDPIFKSSNARDLPGGGGGGMLKFRVDRRITSSETSLSITVLFALLCKGWSISIEAKSSFSFSRLYKTSG